MARKHRLNLQLATRAGIIAAVLLAFVTGRPAVAPTNDAGPDSFSFIVAGDMRNYIQPLSGGKRQFDGACEAIQKTGAGDFMILPGDFDPPEPMRAMMDRYLGTNYLCYYVVGDHEAQTPASMTWFRRWGATDIPHLVRRGPPGAETTIYSFDFRNSHFVMLSDFFNGKTDASGTPDLCDATLGWLKSDLAATHQPLIWIACHKPIECLPDLDSGRLRHAGDSLVVDPARRKQFVALLRQYHVRALLCGHTHGCSVARVQDIWQVDSGHARGAGDPGAPSTFLKIRVAGEHARVDVYRADANGDHYRLRKTVELD